MRGGFNTICCAGGEKSLRLRGGRGLAPRSMTRRDHQVERSLHSPHKPGEGEGFLAKSTYSYSGISQGDFT